MRTIAFLSLLFCTSLLICPAPAGAVEYATFVGGSARDVAYSLAINGQGEVVAAGLTRSTDFPHTTGVYDESYSGGDSDLFIIRLSADLGTLIASTFVGGSGHDGLDFEYDPNFQMDNPGPALALDDKGSVMVTGSTLSLDFPTTAGAHQTVHNGTYEDAFLVRLTPDLTALQASTLLGGSHRDYGRTITIEPDGAVVIGGDTRSIDFPVSSGAYDTTYNGGDRDIFLARLSADFSVLAAATYFGGDESDYNRATLRDDGGRYYITGWTISENLPSTPGAYDPAHNGGSRDIYVALLSADLTTLDACTYLGGHDWGEPYHGGEHEGGCDEANGLAFDGEGNLVLVGTTHSHDFPITAGVFDQLFNDGTAQAYDGVIAVLTADLQALLHASYFGGRHMDEIYAVKRDANGDLVIAAGSHSIDFPVSPDALDVVFSGNLEGIVAKISPDLSSVLYATFLGGEEYEQAYEIVLDASGLNAVVAGHTSSGDFLFPGTGYDQTYNGGFDAFILQTDFGASLPHTLEAGLTATPVSGTLPFSSMMCAEVINATGFSRYAVGRLNVWLPGGQYLSSYRYGFTVLDPAEIYVYSWSQWFPDLPTLDGDTRFQLAVFDVTPAPYNQPPYPESGGVATDQCTVTGWRD